MRRLPDFAFTLLGSTLSHNLIQMWPGVNGYPARRQHTCVKVKPFGTTAKQTAHHYQRGRKPRTDDPYSSTKIDSGIFTKRDTPLKIGNRRRRSRVRPYNVGHTMRESLVIGRLGRVFYHARPPLGLTFRTILKIPIGAKPFDNDASGKRRHSPIVGCRGALKRLTFRRIETDAYRMCLCHRSDI
jgi:hypothetical protein